ncbi:MAG: CvpA family protein [Planctomycetota bacterium]|nr:CvpA family protein [Planctomycetota bacterium]MDA0934968.1 CvpA family protein [Planctomycetota bacterium]
MQSPTTPTEWSAEILARLSSVAWFDWTALAVIFVFLALGLARGMRWQLTRLLGLLAAYAAAIVAGSPLTAMLPAGVVGRPPSPMALHVVQVVLFVAVLVVLGLVFHLARRLVIPAEPTFAGRAVAGAVGLVSGALWMLALITAFQLVLDGWSVASAAKASRSADYGRRALRFASEELLPPPLAEGAAAWSALLGDPPAESAAVDPDAAPSGRPVSPTLVPRAPRD